MSISMVPAISSSGSHSRRIPAVRSTRSIPDNGQHDQTADRRYDPAWPTRDDYGTATVIYLTATLGPGSRSGEGRQLERLLDIPGPREMVRVRVEHDRSRGPGEPG